MGCIALRLLALCPERRSRARDVCLRLHTDCPLLKEDGSATFGFRKTWEAYFLFVRCPSVVESLLVSCLTHSVAEKHICVVPMRAPFYPCVTLFAVMVSNGAEAE